MNPGGQSPIDHSLISAFDELPDQLVLSEFLEPRHAQALRPLRFDVPNRNMLPGLSAPDSWHGGSDDCIQRAVLVVHQRRLPQAEDEFANALAPLRRSFSYSVNTRSVCQISPIVTFAPSGLTTNPRCADPARRASAAPPAPCRRRCPPAGRKPVRQPWPAIASGGQVSLGHRHMRAADSDSLAPHSRSNLPTIRSMASGFNTPE